VCVFVGRGKATASKAVGVAAAPVSWEKKRGSSAYSLSSALHQEERKEKGGERTAAQERDATVALFFPHGEGGEKRERKKENTGVGKRKKKGGDRFL